VTLVERVVHRDHDGAKTCYRPYVRQGQNWKVEETSKKTLLMARNVLGVAGLILGGYLLVTSQPDLYRDIKISRM
jgi:hypothetical protein